MEEFQQRVVDEKAELDDKRSRLEPFLSSNRFQTLPAEERDRMTEQAKIMSDYSDVLRRRIAAFTP